MIWSIDCLCSLPAMHRHMNFTGKIIWINIVTNKYGRIPSQILHLMRSFKSTLNQSHIIVALCWCSSRCDFTATYLLRVDPCLTLYYITLYYSLVYIIIYYSLDEASIINRSSVSDRMRVLHAWLTFASYFALGQGLRDRGRGWLWSDWKWKGRRRNPTVDEVGRKLF